MKHPQFIFPMLKILLKAKNQKRLSELLDIADSMIPQLKDPDTYRKNVSDSLANKIVALVNDRFPTVNLSRADLDLDPGPFLARFPRSEIEYEKAAAAGGISPESPADSRLSSLFGNFARFYLFID